MNFVSYGSIEKSGTGIEKSGTGISTFRRMQKHITVLVFLLVGGLAWVGSAIAVAGNGTGTSSASGVQKSPTVLVNDDLVTVSLFDGYRVVSGYGYLDKDFTQISLYSLEYVYVIGEDSNDGANLLVAGNGTGDATTGDGTQETAPVAGNGTGSPAANGADDDQLKAWGIAEVVLSERGIADLIVYRFNEEGALEEVGVYSGVEVH